MFLTRLDYEGAIWTVELTVTPDPDLAGLLEFAFSRAMPGGESTRVTWTVGNTSLEALAREGAEVSEELLREQLALALAEQRTMDVAGLR